MLYEQQQKRGSSNLQHRFQVTEVGLSDFQKNIKKVLEHCLCCHKKIEPNVYFSTLQFFLSILLMCCWKQKTQFPFVDQQMHAARGSSYNHQNHILGV